VILSHGGTGAQGKAGHGVKKVIVNIEYLVYNKGTWFLQKSLIKDGIQNEK